MGGLAVMKDLGETVLKDSPEWFRSAEAMVSKTEAGKLWASTIKNKVEPAVGQMHQQLLDTAVKAGTMSPQEAVTQARKTVKEQVFGKNNIMMAPLLKAAENQGGTLAATHLADAHNVYWAEDSLTGSAWRSKVRPSVKNPGGVDIPAASYYSTAGKSEHAIKEISRTLNLPLISVPHAFQAPLNSLAVNGVRASMQAFAEFMHDSASAKLLATQSGAMSQELGYELQGATKGKTAFSLLLDPMKGAFSAERRYGIAFSAVSGKYAAMNAAENLVKGGSGARAAELQLKVLGLDPAKILSSGGQLTQDEIERAAYRSASEIMGFRSPLETPVGWDSNGLARIASIYKQYGFRTMRLHQQVLQRAYQSEGLMGVAKKAALYATLFPIAGEMIKGAEGAATLRNPWSKEQQKGNLAHNEYIDAVAMAMGFNMIYSATRSSMYHNLANFVSGPVISTGTDLAQDVINMIQNPKHPVKPLSKDLLRRGGLPGRILAPRVFPNKKDQPHY
jgi:hypothetical protein